MNRRPPLSMIAVYALVGLAPAANAAAPEPLTLAEQADARGGYLVAGGLAFEFGAVVKTFENGLLALQTQVTWTPEGVEALQQVGEAATKIAPPAGAAADQSETTFYSQNGAAFAHKVTDGQLLNVLMNTDSNRTYLQQTDITIQLPGFEGVQGDMQRGLLGLRLDDDVGLGSVGALR